MCGIQRRSLEDMAVNREGGDAQDKGSQKSAQNLYAYINMNAYIYD